jgi:nucleoside-diphosphate-sugar epimerase
MSSSRVFSQLSSKPSVLVTGANGFVGQALCRAIFASGWGMTACSRSPIPVDLPIKKIPVAVINGSTNWRDAFDDVDVVIHLAARVHVMHETVADPLDAFLDVNVRGTVNLARQAAEAGVKRFVYVSSIKVNGESTQGNAFSELDVPSPVDPYGISKWRAETALMEVSQQTGMEVVIVRPPLVYGPGVRANFYQLMRLVKMGVPLPLASIRNRRSLVYVYNLVDALMLCAIHPSAAGQTYLVSDAERLSTPELIREIALCMGNTPRLFHFPLAPLRMLTSLCRQSAAFDRLTQSLEVSHGKIGRELGWIPPYTLRQGLAETMAWFTNRKP